MLPIHNEKLWDQEKQENPTICNNMDRSGVTMLSEKI